MNKYVFLFLFKANISFSLFINHHAFQIKTITTITSIRTTTTMTDEVINQVMNDPEKQNDVPTAPDDSSCHLGNILEQDKKTQRSKMHKSALFHLDIFFRDFPRKPSEHLPNDSFKNFRSFKDIVYDDLRHQSNDFFGELATYFAEHARSRRGVKCANDLLSFTCATNYFSAVKNFYLDKFRAKKVRDLPCFDERTWTQYYQKIRNTKEQQARSTGKKVIDSKDMASLDEMKALAVICLWAGSTKGVVFSI